MKKWIIVLCAVFAVALVFISIASPNQEQKDCCLCDSFRFHAPCLIDLEKGDLIELDLYFPHETKVGELAEVQTDTSMAIKSASRLSSPRTTVMQKRFTLSLARNTRTIPLISVVSLITTPTMPRV